MADETLNNATEEHPPAAGPGIQVGRDVDGSIITGNNNTVNNVINMAAPAVQAFRSLHQLPQPPDDFTGRDELIAGLLEDFNTHKGATITGRPAHLHGLTGMGGIGKTALGLVVAHQLAMDYPDAQIFLDLKGTTTPLGAVEIMRHVILSFEPAMDLRALDEANMRAAYLSVLHGKKALLFLDNARSAEQIEPLRPPETCALLVTSRWVFKVPKLSSHHLDVLREEEAVAFLLELCPRIREHAAGLAQACARLPLALRIAGSFLDVNDHWQVEKYLDRLKDHTQRLAALEDARAQVDLGRDHPGLQAAFALSYGSLTEEDQKRWRMLGVFPTSFQAMAAQAVWGLEEDRTLELLGLLRRYSLLDYDGTSRYSLHDLLAEYACSEMTGDEEHVARLEHTSHYKDVLRAANGLYLKGGEKVLSGLHLFDLEWENIRAGQAWVSAEWGRDRAVAELCVSYLGAGANILDLRQHPVERIQWLEAAASAARETGDRRGEGVALGNLGLAHADLGETRKAIESYEQYLAIARETGDRRGEGSALGNLGLAHADLGETRKAIEFYEQHLAITCETGDRRGEGIALGNLGIAYKNLGKTRKAIEFYEQHLAIARETGDRHGEGSALGNLGIAYKNLGETRKAIELYEQALGIDREIGDRRGEGADLGNLGNAYADLGETRKAMEFHEQALEVDRAIGNRRGEGNALGNLGAAYADLGETRKAIEFYEQHLAIARETDDRHGEGRALFNMGLAIHKLGENDRAAGLMGQAIAIFEAFESPYAEEARSTLEEWGVPPGEQETGRAE